MNQYIICYQYTYECIFYSFYLTFDRRVLKDFSIYFYLMVLLNMKINFISNSYKHKIVIINKVNHLLFFSNVIHAVIDLEARCFQTYKACKSCIE